MHDSQLSTHKSDLFCNTAGSGSSFTRQVSKSSSDTVCILLRVSKRTDNANLDNITRNSNTEDYNMVPVARSYNNQNWERIAGPYAQDLSVNNCCSLVIPNLPNLPDGKFILMSFAHSISSKEEVSRFFQQTTFGPTRSMINSWNYSNDMTQEMRKWLQTQMDATQTPITSHRAFFRERVDKPMNKGASQYNRPRHPCARYSRWFSYSFTPEDYDSTFVVRAWNGQFLIEVDGVPRTVVSSWKSSENEALPLNEAMRFCECIPPSFSFPV